MQYKKIFFYFLSFVILYGCSTSNDSNGNSTTTVVPVSPTNLSGTVISTTQINLSWTDNSANETGFKIERKTGTGTYAVVGTVNADVLTYTNLGLTPNTAYTYRVYSYNAAGNSPIYSNEVTLFTITTDIDGNTYQLVTICNQTWMQSNLNVSHYRNGDVIPQVTDPTAWSSLTTGAWCYYNNDTANGTVYGKLYNWYAVNDPRGLSPLGWHVPTDAEWTNLTGCLGGESLAGGKMKATTLWDSPNTGASNSCGFTSLPGGVRYSNGTFQFKGYSSNFWTSTLDWISTLNNTAFYRNNVSVNASVFRGNDGNINNALSVRCVKD
jgi:uncharacterized protein (TIGR02145 family)